MLIRIQPTTFHQVFCESMLYSKVIFKSAIDADDLSADVNVLSIACRLQFHQLASCEMSLIIGHNKV